jgi:hypothetical protein
MVMTVMPVCSSFSLSQPPSFFGSWLARGDGPPQTRAAPGGQNKTAAISAAVPRSHIRPCRFIIVLPSFAEVIDKTGGGF